MYDGTHAPFGRSKLSRRGSEAKTLHATGKRMRHVLHMIVSIGFLLGCSTHVGAEIASKVNGLERVTQKLVAPPFLPAHEQVQSHTTYSTRQVDGAGQGCLRRQRLAGAGIASGLLRCPNTRDGYRDVRVGNTEAHRHFGQRSAEAPKPTTVTSNPVRPSVRFSMGSFSDVRPTRRHVPRLYPASLYTRGGVEKKAPTGGI